MQGEALPTLETLLARCGAGDADGLRLLYDRTSAHLFGLLVRILVREDLAQEALQDVFVSIWRNAAKYNERKGAAFTWIVSIARYRAIDIVRSRRRETHVGETVAASVDDAGDDDVPALVDQHTDSVRLKNCMQKLQISQRNAISLAFLSGLTHREVAERLGAPLGSIKSWIRRGLDELKGCLER